MVISPTNGRIVWFTPPRDKEFWPAGFAQHDPLKPLAAMVVHVWGDRMVNLTVFDSNGKAHSFTSVDLLQDDDPKPEHLRFASWMPYQKGQAAKTEALEAARKPVETVHPNGDRDVVGQSTLVRSFSGE